MPLVGRNDGDIDEVVEEDRGMMVEVADDEQDDGWNGVEWRVDDVEECGELWNVIGWIEADGEVDDLKQDDVDLYGFAVGDEQILDLVVDDEDVERIDVLADGIGNDGSEADMEICL